MLHGASLESVLGLESAGGAPHYCACPPSCCAVQSCCITGAQAAGLHLCTGVIKSWGAAQGAGELLGDPTWRTPPAAFSTDLLRMNFPHELRNLPGRSYQAPSTPTTPPANGHFEPGADGAAAAAEPAFRFAVPGKEHIEFSGPGGDTFVDGAARGLTLVVRSCCNMESLLA